MNYLDGKICGDEGTYNCRVELLCSHFNDDYNPNANHNFEIVSVKESQHSVCSYDIQLNIPISCSLLYK